MGGAYCWRERKDDSLKDLRMDSRWKETLYVLHEIQSAVNLKMGLAFSLVNWQEIQKGLREPPGKRTHQHRHLDDTI